MELHDRNYTDIVFWPPKSKKVTKSQQKTLAGGTITYASDRAMNMITKRINIEANHYDAGTLPERYKDPKRPIEESLAMFRKDFLEA